MKITNNTRSRLFRIAHAIKSQFTTFAKALAHAWRVIKLQARMLVGDVAFQYRKVDGSIREAVGTLDFTYEAKGTGKAAPSDSIIYFDRGANGIRSFKISNLV
jgi:hypothetical protein